jgi:hypothetical protein
MLFLLFFSFKMHRSYKIVSLLFRGMVELRYLQELQMDDMVINNLKLMLHYINKMVQDQHRQFPFIFVNLLIFQVII